MSFTPSGVEFVARNLRGYLSDLNKADQAQQAVGRSAAGIGGKFGQAQGQAQSFGRAVSGLGSNVAGLGSSLNGSLSSLSGFGSALSNVAQIAAGNLLASGISTFVGGVKEFISIGADAVGEAQKLEAGLGALLTQNNLYERQTKEVTVAVGNLGEMQAEAALKSEDLAFKQRELTADINRQNAAIQEQRQRIIQMADGLDKNEQVAKLQQMEIALEGMNRELVKTGQEQGKLTNITQEYTTATVTSYEQINSFSEAQRLAAQQTQDLLGFVDKLSIISPFESDQVALVTKFAVGAGLAVDEAKAFTAGFLDLAAAVGIGSEELSFASDQLLQVAKVGQITTVDLRQLRRLGIDLEKIIGVQMGLSIDEFNEKAKQSPEIFQELFNGVAEFSAKTFPGAAQKLASSLGGISSTFKDIFRVSAKNLLRPMVDAAGPAMSEFLGNLASVATGPALAGVGQRLGEVLGQGIARAQEAIAKVTGAFSRFGIKGAARSILGQLGFSQDTISQVTSIVGVITEAFGKIQGAYQKFGIKGAAVSLLGQLGLDPETIGIVRTTLDKLVTNITTILTSKLGSMASITSIMNIGAMLGIDPETTATILSTINTITTAITSFATQVASVISGISFNEWLGALTGIGAVLAGGAIAGLIIGLGAAIAGLLTPINLIIAGAALLGAAWAGNWMNIQGVTEQALTTITNLFNTYWPLIQAVTLTAWEVIKGVFAGFVTALGPVITQLQTQFTQIGATLSSLGINWSSVWNAILTATGIVAAGIGAAILGIIGVVAGLATGLASGISATIAMFQGLADNVAGIVTGLTTVFVGWVNTISALLAGDFAGAWEGFKVVLQGSLTFWTSMWGGMLEGVLGVVGIISSTIGGFVQGIVGFFQGMYDELIGHSIIPDLINGIVKWFQGLPQKITTALSNLVDKVIAPFETLIEEAGNIIGDGDTWLEIGEMAMQGLLNGIEKNSGIVLEYLKSLLGSFLDIFTGSDGLDAHSPSRVMMDIGRDAIRGLQIGAENASGALYSSLGGITQGAIDTLMTGMTVNDRGFQDRFIDDLNLGGLLRGGGSLTGMGLGGGHLRDVRKIIHGGIRGNIGLLESGGSVGDISNIAGGIAQQFNLPPSVLAQYTDLDKQIGHLTGTFGTMFDRMRVENLKGSVGLVGQFAGIGQAFADMVTQETEAVTGLRVELNKLLGEGDKLNAAYDKQKNKLATLQEELAVLTTGQGKNAMAIEKLTESLSFGERQLAIYNEELATLTPDTIPWDKKKLAIDKLTETMDMQRQELEKLQAANSADALAIEKKTLAIEELTTELAENQKAIEANAQAAQKQRRELELMAFDMFSSEDASVKSQTAMIDLLQEFIDSQQQSLFIQADEASQAAGITGILYDRVSAQAELNRLLVEQQRRQEEILAIEKAQKDMAFLQQQISLLDLIQSKGLNPADILGGVQLGLEASASDLLTVTNNIVQAMIDQINEDLQIASPSKVMAKIGRRVIEGMVVGIDRGESLLSEAVRSIPILNGNIPQPAFSQAAMAGAGNTYNTYYEMPMTVNTAATPQGVIRQYDIKRSMYAAG